MNRVTYRYKVSIELLEKLEKFVIEKRPNLIELTAEFHKLKMFYRCGLAHLDN